MLHLWRFSCSFLFSYVSMLISSKVSSDLVHFAAAVAAAVSVDATVFFLPIFSLASYLLADIIKSVGYFKNLCVFPACAVHSKQ